MAVCGNDKANKRANTQAVFPRFCFCFFGMMKFARYSLYVYMLLDEFAIESDECNYR